MTPIHRFEGPMKFPWSEAFTWCGRRDVAPVSYVVITGMAWSVGAMTPE